MPFSATELRQVSSHISTQWFLPVEGSYLTLMEIDPWRVHAYWSVAQADLVAAQSGLPDAGHDARLVLRFTDLSPGTPDVAPPHARFDIEVQGVRNNWYVGLWRDARHYSAELGLRAADGAFAALVRSNEVVTPRAGPSPEADFRHLEVRPPRALEVQQLTSGAFPNDDLLVELFPRRLAPVDEYPFVVAQPSGVVVEEPPFPTLDAVGEVAPAELSWDAAGTAGERDGAADASERFPQISAAEIDPYRAVARGERARVLARIGVPLPLVAGDAVAPAVDLEPQPLPIPFAAADTCGYSLGGPQMGADGALAWQPAIPLEAVLAGAVSSPGQGVSPVQVTVELVVHGRCTSMTSLTLCGEPVPVRNDCSFRLRLPVEPGSELAELVRRLCGRRADEDDG